MVRFSVFALSLLVACGREAPPPAAAVAVAVVDAPPIVAAPAPVSPPRREVAVDAGPIGVAVCDAYVATYRRCVDAAIPEDDRAAHREVIEGQRVAWARAKADPTLAAGLPEACAAARTAARTSLPRCKGW